MNFREYIKNRTVSGNKRILEFGPLNWPLISNKEYKNIFFADIRSTDDIKKLYTSNEYLSSTGVSIDIDSIVDIDFVVKDEYSKVFKNAPKFDVVYLSHVVEHMPDIIHFFKDIKNIIKDNGELILLYPDSRYCFDHFRNGTSFIEAYDVFVNKKIHNNGIFDFANNVVHENKPSFFWNDDKQNSILPENDFKHSLEVFKKAKEGVMPDDVHFWPFADYQFVKFLYDMDRAGLLGFDIKEFYKTQENTQEFMVILTPKNKNRINRKNYIRILDEIYPSIIDMNARHRYDSLTDTNKTLVIENEKIRQELYDVYHSKRWTYVSKLINLTNIISRKRSSSDREII